MSNVIESIERDQMRKLPSFAAGDRVKVHFQVVEGTRRRTQVFEGVVLKRQGSGARETFTVRKQSFGVGVERTFPVHSPKIEKLEIAARGQVRRAKLYYLRGRVGKRARIAERRWGVDEELLVAEQAEAVDAAGVTADEAVAEAVGPAPEQAGEEAAAEPGAETEAEVAVEAEQAEEQSPAPEPEPEAEAVDAEPEDEAVDAEPEGEAVEAEPEAEDK